MDFFGWGIYHPYTTRLTLSLSISLSLHSNFILSSLLLPVIPAVSMAVSGRTTLNVLLVPLVRSGQATSSALRAARKGVLFRLVHVVVLLRTKVGWEGGGGGGFCGERRERRDFSANDGTENGGGRRGQSAWYSRPQINVLN